jgi:hypothetical protein
MRSNNLIIPALFGQLIMMLLEFKMDEKKHKDEIQDMELCVHFLIELLKKEKKV